MVTIVHISDTHLGNRQYGSDIRRQDFTDAFAQSVERAIERDVDAIIHTGDLFHRRTPPLPQVNQCIAVLRRADDAGIPFLGIVGNHDRKMDDQWLDLMAHTGTANRLDSSPTIVGEGEGEEAVALYGIDAVPSPAWETTDFELQPPENDDAYRLLCMHQLLHPPVPEIMADYPAESVIDRLNIEFDGLALGDYHEAVSKDVQGVDVWYAGSTERGSAGEEGPRSFTLLSEFGNHTMTRSHVDLDTRDFQPIQIAFDEDDGYAHAREAVENYDLTDAVAVVTLTGKRTSLTASDVHEIALDRGAAVARVDDNRGREHLDTGVSPSADVEDPDTLIDKRLVKAGLSDPALDVEEMVRDEATSTAALDDNAEQLISEAQDDAFESGDPDTVLGDGPSEEAESEAETELEPEAQATEAESEAQAAEIESKDSDTGASENNRSSDQPAPVDTEDGEPDIDTEPDTEPIEADSTEPETGESVKGEPSEARTETEPTQTPSEVESQTPETEAEATDGGNDTDTNTATDDNPETAGGSSSDESASSTTSQASFTDLAGGEEDTQ